jgi:CheY-like chemotaxis protein
MHAAAPLLQDGGTRVDRQFAGLEAADEGEFFGRKGAEDSKAPDGALLARILAGRTQVRCRQARLAIAPTMSFFNVTSRRKFQGTGEWDLMRMTTLESMKILVVEDEPLIGFDIEEMLVAEGAAPLRVQTLQEARRAIAAQRPDAAVLDALLPDGVTFPLARELVAAGIAIVFVTGYAPGIPRDLRRHPIVGKPFTLEELTKALLEALNRGAG